MLRRVFVLSVLMLAALFWVVSEKPRTVAAANNISVYGAWHC